MGINTLRILVVSALYLLTFEPMALGLELKPSEIRGEESILPVKVLQQRYFRKQWRPEVGLLTGSLLNEAYTDTLYAGARVSLFATEWLGIEGQFSKTQVKDSDDRKALNNLTYLDPEDRDRYVSPDPEVNRIHQVSDASLIAAPFYGKINMMDQMIIYSDLYVSAGMTQVKSDQGLKSGMSIGVGQRFYLRDSLSFRLDFRDRIFRETRAGRDSTRHALSVDVGTSYFFL